jgi:hypothetical protein
MSNTSGNTTLAQHDMVTDAEVAAAASDLIAVWGGSTAAEAAVNSMRYMINNWRAETIQRLKNRDSATALQAYHDAEATAEATYADRFEPL